ncbi:type 4 prepilin peptidase 1 [Pasteurella langaaensis DSM 22999]|uniref:Type 4 prepilin peptidase 1 n=1 Tax=Alitibacter langaaensis DSM 22999 TaxID=1122935 RepID=A0A2U0T5D2_9PAST|nr:A24 family peptidase [Pasteurella langaaensis]PVX38809.1 type 4 prepilin peptidase 1 [Pasteurella langaaensis DSM 22999]
MITLAFFLIGGLVGLSIRHYWTHFHDRLAQEVYSTYCEIFPENPPHFRPQKISLPPIKCGQKWRYFLGFATLFGFCQYLFSSSLLAAFIAAFTLSILITVSVIDWRYQLISPTFCQLLACLGVGAAYLQLLPISLEQSLQSVALSFALFFLFFHLTQYLYQREAFGRGDYWLISGLSSFLPWQQLPLFYFIACSCAIAYALFSKQQQIALAPFLSIGALAAFLLNVLG